MEEVQTVNGKETETGGTGGKGAKSSRNEQGGNATNVRLSDKGKKSKRQNGNFSGRMGNTADVDTPTWWEGKIVKIDILIHNILFYL